MERQILPDTGRVSRAKNELAQAELAAAREADRQAAGAAQAPADGVTLRGWLAGRLVTAGERLVAAGERLAGFGEPAVVAGGDPQRC